MKTRKPRLWALIPVVCFILIVCWAAAPAAGQGGDAPRALTAADYARAEKFMGYNTAPLVLCAGVRPAWLPGDRFWYRNALEDGKSEFILVDPKKKMRGPAFDHAALAAALSKASGKTFDAAHLPFTSFEFSEDGKAITFRAEGKRWSYDLKGLECKPLEGGEAAPPERGRGAGPRPGGAPEVVSPDGRLAVFIRDHNLWVREVATTAEKPLTTDGVEDYGYATDNAGWARSDRPVVAWSPDSTKIATFQQDQRQVGEMYLVETKVGHPTLQAWKYPLPGDEVVSMIERVVVHLDGPRVVRLKMASDQHRSTFSDDIKASGGSLGDVEWSPDGNRLVFVSSSRDHKIATVREADPETGEVRDVFEETAATYFESGSDGANWRFLPASNEIVWYSERTNWAHFYLYDLGTGRLKKPITSGEWPVLQLLRVDEKTRRITFLAGGREKGRDPYFRHLYSAGLDGGGLRLLTPEDADHEVVLSPSGLFFVDSYSKPDVPPVSVLRNAEGRLLLELERAGISRLQAAGWKPPIPITVKARDGQTDLYGLMFRPTGFDPARKYPIINNIYPGPQSGSVRSRSFLPASGDAQALAELGFVVVQIDGMGNPGRSKAFHDAYYGNMGDNTLPDQVAGMKELAGRFPWIDIDRAGIYGHSGGGFAACDAMFRHPDFFKVGVSQAGNHDNRGYEDDWGEKWQGLLVKNADGTSNYDDQANQNHAGRLKGKLLLAHGTTDGNVPPYLTLLVVNELIKANKDFDLILFPNRGHGFGNEPYMVRRRWDYFVRHLLGAEPPAGYELKAPTRSGEGWISLFNGRNLEGWIPKFAGSEAGVNVRNTFRVEDGILKVSYDGYEKFAGEFGHLFYKEPFGRYVLRVEYRFTGEQAPGGPSWGFRNSGVMFHSQSPATMAIDQLFPVSIEAQFLGGAGPEERPTMNLCTPGTNIVMNGELVTRHCTNSSSATYRGDEWVTVEIDVDGGGAVRHFVEGKEVLAYEQPQLDPSDADARKVLREGRLLLESGYIALQAESHPIEFRKVEIKLK